MKSKLTIVLALLLLVVLAMPESAEAQAGWSVTRSADVNTLIFGGNNQQVSAVTFVGEGTEEDAVIAIRAGDATTITVTYGDLMITNMTRDSDMSLTADGVTDNFDIWCSTDITSASPTIDACTGESQPRATIANDDDGKGSVTITIPNAYQNDFRLAYVRLDVSELANEAEVPISIKRGADATVPLGGGTGSGSVSGVVGTIAMGLKVTADPKAGLACGTDVFPTITVAEGFKGAWDPLPSGDDPAAPSTNVVKVKIAVGNFPDEGTIEWPKSTPATADTDSDEATEEVTIGTLTLVTGDSKADGSAAVYSYAPDAAVTGANMRDANDLSNAHIRSFSITPKKIELAGDQTLSVTAMLYPMAETDAKGDKSNLGSVLSFAADSVAPEEGKGEEWLVLSECVTYLLYPFVTCGDTQEWSTGLSVSNTSKDDGVFGAFDETKEQSGSVILYGFPGGGEASVSEMLTSDLAAGDTITRACDKTRMAGMQGYLIIKANFQHARGSAFLMGNFSGGAVVDVTHGYLAEVIDDPADRSEKLD